MHTLTEAVHDAHAGLGVLPLLQDGALAGDAAGAALQATSVIEASRAVGAFLVQRRRAHAHELAELLGGKRREVFGSELDVPVRLVVEVLSIRLKPDFPLGRWSQEMMDYLIAHWDEVG